MEGQSNDQTTVDDVDTPNNIFGESEQDPQVIEVVSKKSVEGTNYVNKGEDDDNDASAEGEEKAN